MAPKKSSKSSSRKSNVPELNSQHAARGGSFEAARSRLPPNINWEKLNPEKQKNCERAFTAASRRSDRDVDARYQSALTASDMHFLRTGKYLRVSREMVMNEDMYEEEDNHSRLWTSNLRQDSDPRMAALNQQYQNIDLQFQAAFPGFSNRGVGMAPAMANMPFSANVAAAAPQYDNTTQYHAQSGYAPHGYTPVGYNSDEASPSPMTDSAAASPMVGMDAPGTPQMGFPLPSHPSSSDMMGLPGNIAYTATTFDPSYGYFNDTAVYGGDGMVDNTAIWGAGVSDEFPEFVNY